MGRLSPDANTRASVRVQRHRAIPPGCWRFWIVGIPLPGFHGAPPSRRHRHPELAAASLARKRRPLSFSGGRRTMAKGRARRRITRVCMTALICPLTALLLARGGRGPAAQQRYQMAVARELASRAVELLEDEGASPVLGALLAIESVRLQDELRGRMTLNAIGQREAASVLFTEDGGKTWHER